MSEWLTIFVHSHRNRNRSDYGLANSMRTDRGSRHGRHRRLGVFQMKALIKAAAPELWETARSAWQNIGNMRLNQRTADYLLSLQGPLYSSWNDAAAAARTNYDADLLNGFRVYRALINRKLVAKINPMLLSAVRGGPRPMYVTDFGGSTGEMGRALLGAEHGIRYRVTESAGMLDWIKAHPKAGARGVLFTNDLLNSTVFYSSGTIQYLPEPYELLHRAFKSAWHAVVLARNCFSERTLYRVQRSRLFDNGMGEVPRGYDNVEIRYPHQTIRETKVLQIAKSHGFRLTVRAEDDHGVIPYSDFVYGASLTFVRAT